MPFPMRSVEVREGEEDAAARAVMSLGHQLVKNIDSLNLEYSRQRDDGGAESHRYASRPRSR